jgi:hypothetical protein
MIYRGAGFLAVWFLAHPLPPFPVSKLDRRQTGRLRKRDKLLSGEGVGGKGWDQETLVLDKSFNTLCPELIAAWHRKVIRGFQSRVCLCC